MNQEEYYTHLVQWAKSKRTAFINDEEYAFFSMQIILQLLNLMDNRISLSKMESYKPNIELISLYKDYLDLNINDFKSQNIELLKVSLENSINASIVPELLPFEIKNLIPNTKESFLILPITVAYYDFSIEDWQFHEISCRIQNKNNFIQLEFFDKANQFYSLRNNFKPITMDPHPIQRNKRDIINYYYIVPKESVKKLSTVLCLGTVDIRKQINELLNKIKMQKSDSNTMESDFSEKFFSKIKKLAINEYYGEIVSTYQNLVGNCLIKELDIALKIALGEEKECEVSKIKHSLSFKGIQAKYLYTYKLPHINSTKEIYLSLIAILLDRLETLKFDISITKEIMEDIFNTYSYLKHCRINHPLAKKLQMYLTNNFYKKQDLYIPKLDYTNIHADIISMNISNIHSIKRSLNRMPIVPKNIDSLKKEINKVKKNKQKKFKHSLKYIDR